VNTSHMLIGSNLLLLTGCATGMGTGPSSLARETNLTPMRQQTEAQQRIDDRECEVWTRATKGPNEPLPAAELRYGACVIARGYRAELIGSPTSTPVERPLNTVLEDMRACHIGRDDAWANYWWGGFLGVAITKAYRTEKAVSCLVDRGYIVEVAWNATRSDARPTPRQPTTVSAPIVPPSTPPPPTPPPPTVARQREVGATPTTLAHGVSDTAQAWILGEWSTLAGITGSVAGLAHFDFRREGSEIKWRMTRSGWFLGVQTTQKASGSVNKISESDLELLGTYTSSNLGNVVGQPVRHSFTRDGDSLKGYELTNEGTQSPMSLKRAQ
jgi:hypothetical protein